MENKSSEYHKSYLAVGWDWSEKKSFVIVGTHVNAEALGAFTEKQINGFKIRIIFSKNFFGEDAKDNAIAFNKNVENELSDNGPCRFFSGRSWYMENEDIDKLKSKLYSGLTNSEINHKGIKRRELNLDE